MADRAWHYDKAEELLTLYNECWQEQPHDRRAELLAQAQAHATLATVALSATVVPFEVPATV